VIRSDLTPALVEQVFSMAGAVSEALRAAVREAGITDSLAHLVWAIDPDVDPMPLRQIAGRLHCDPSNITLLADRLEEKGLAERRPHPADGRVRTLVLTPAGEQLRRSLMERVGEVSPLAALDVEQQRTLHELLATALESRPRRRA
jgi:DNA-binding MarR family transcriptional regulator